MQVYVFPIENGVFFPATNKPLNIFEPRYLQMIEDSLRTGTPIALGFLEPQATFVEAGSGVGQPLPFVKQIAGYGKPVIIEKHPDGTLLIFLQSLGRVRLGAVVASSTPYFIAEAEALSENTELGSDQVAQLITLQKLLSNWIVKTLTDPNVREQFLAQVRTPEEIVSCCGSFLIQDPDLQQVVLEENNLNARINLLIGLISSGESL